MYKGHHSSDHHRSTSADLDQYERRRSRNRCVDCLLVTAVLLCALIVLAVAVFCFFYVPTKGPRFFSFEPITESERLRLAPSNQTSSNSSSSSSSSNSTSSGNAERSGRLRDREELAGREEEEVTVNTPDGMITGVQQNMTGRGYVYEHITHRQRTRTIRRQDAYLSVFRDIPYAQVNAKSPFSAAQPVRDWSGSLRATGGSTSASAYCPPSTSYSVAQMKCLHLTVWSPARLLRTQQRIQSSQNLEYQRPSIARSRRSVSPSLSASRKRPVLVYLAGDNELGLYQSKLSDQEGSKLALLGNLVIVTFDYRNGLFANLNLQPNQTNANQSPDRQQSSPLNGNFGLADQLIALGWIHRNIEAFGGDSSQVTLFGEGGGAFVAGLHALNQHHYQSLLHSLRFYDRQPKRSDRLSLQSQSNRNVLFQRLILHNGSPFVDSTQLLQNPNSSALFIRLLNCSSTSDQLRQENRNRNLPLAKNPNLEHEDDLDSAVAFLADAGFEEPDERKNAQLIQCLQSKSHEQLKAAQNQVLKEDPFAFRPSLDRQIVQIVPTDLMLNNGRMKSNEMSMFPDTLVGFNWHLRNSQLPKQMREILNPTSSWTRRSVLQKMQKIEQMYKLKSISGDFLTDYFLFDRDAHSTSASLSNELQTLRSVRMHNLVSHLLIKCPVLRFARFAKAQNATTYLYSLQPSSSSMLESLDQDQNSKLTDSLIQAISSFASQGKVQWNDADNSISQSSDSLIRMNESGDFQLESIERHVDEKLCTQIISSA